MTIINPNFLGYELDIDYWRREYDTVIREHSQFPARSFDGVMADKYAKPGELELLGFIGCCHWLNGSVKIKSSNKTYNTYSMKHDAEQMMRDRGGPYYVSQAILEMAALYEGYFFRYYYGNPNACINIGKRDANGKFLVQLNKYYWFQHQPVITYPVIPEHLIDGPVFDR